MAKKGKSYLMQREPAGPEVSTVVIHCSAVECDAVERRHWGISEQRHMSGSESVGEHVLMYVPRGKLGETSHTRQFIYT